MGVSSSTWGLPKTGACGICGMTGSAGPTKPGSSKAAICMQCGSGGCVMQGSKWLAAKEALTLHATEWPESLTGTCAHSH
jgi:hypothetical protein